MGKFFSRLSDKQIQDIYEQTGVRRCEIKTLYKDFMKQHPKGKLKLVHFTESFQKSVPNGGDVTKIAEHVFKTFDRNGDGKLDFQEYIVGMSITRANSLEKKLRWAFSIYDANKDGNISRDEMLDVVTAVYKMMDPDKIEDDMTPEKRVDQIFEILDIDCNDVIGLEEFIEGAKLDPSIAKLFAI